METEAMSASLLAKLLQTGIEQDKPKSEIQSDTLKSI